MTAPLRALASAITTCLDAAKRALASANVADQDSKAAAKSAQDAQTQADAVRAIGATVGVNASTASAAANTATTQATNAAASAAASQTSATASQASRLASEAARDSVNTTGKVFADTATGIAGTASGQTFAVLDSSLQFWNIYKNNAGAAALVATTYTRAYVDSFVADLGAFVEPSYIPLVYDGAGNVAVWLRDGKLGAVALGPNLMLAVAADTTFLSGVRNGILGDAPTVTALATGMLPTLGLVDVQPVESAYVPLVTDSAGNVAVWLRDGKLGALGLGPTLMASVAADATLLSGVRNAIVTDPTSIAAIAAGVAPSLGFTNDLTPNPATIPLVSDSAGNVALWLTDGKLDALGVGPGLDAVLQGKVSALKFAPSNVPASSNLPVATDGRALWSWRAKLAKLQTNVASVAKILITGDSWTEHPYISSQLSALLYSKYVGKSGEGWITISNQYGYLNGVTFARSAGWTLYDASTGAAPVNGCGIDGMSIATTTTTDTVTIGSLTTTDLDIYYRNTTGTFRYQVDGGAWTTVTGDGSLSLGKATISGLSNAAHTVKVDTTGNTGTVVLYGFRATRPAVNGVEFSKAGNSGINGVQLSLWASTYVQAIMADILPDVIVVILGTNDYRQASSPTQYIAALTAYVTAVRAASPNTGFVFVAPADTNGVVVTPLTQYRDALYAFCIANGHEFYNMHDEWGSWAAMNSLGLMLDTLHPNNQGGYMLAKRLHNLLLEL